MSPGGGWQAESSHMQSVDPRRSVEWSCTNSLHCHCYKLYSVHGFWFLRSYGERHVTRRWSLLNPKCSNLALTDCIVSRVAREFPVITTIVRIYCKGAWSSCITTCIMCMYNNKFSESYRYTQIVMISDLFGCNFLNFAILTPASTKQTACFLH